jgi:nucleotide-binding universal stress UspA family protein
MQKFHNILFVSNMIADELEALKQALSLASRNKATLNALVVCPEFSKEMIEYKTKYEAYLANEMKSSIKAACDVLRIGKDDLPINIEVESGVTPAIRIISHVLKYDYDLVIKAAEANEGTKGFKAMDMELLRKCPCPVWLCRPIMKHRDEIRVTVAIDPETMAKDGHDLSLRLLRISRSLADTCNGELDIISCWDCEFEEYLRHSSWIDVSREELNKSVLETQLKHRAALDKIISESGISGKIKVDHVRGAPDKVIPKYLLDNKVDILVMGTVARTGIQSFVIGNTAENILQKVTCSLMALKPNGFVSPVKNY